MSHAWKVGDRAATTLMLLHVGESKPKRHEGTVQEILDPCPEGKLPIKVTGFWFTPEELSPL